VLGPDVIEELTRHTQIPRDRERPQPVIQQRWEEIFEEVESHLSKARLVRINVAEPDAVNERLDLRLLALGHGEVRADRAAHATGWSESRIAVVDHVHARALRL
jgi:hypothetical protein